MIEREAGTKAGLRDSDFPALLNEAANTPMN